MVFTMPGIGNDQMSQMIQMATLYRQNPEALIKVMAATGQPPPPLPAPVQVNPLADITPQPQSQKGMASPMNYTPPVPQLKTIPMTPPVVTGADIKAATPPLTAPKPGFNFGALAQAMQGLQAPPQPQLMQPQFAPAAPIRPGGQVDPQLLNSLITLMSGAQNIRPTGGVPSLGGLIAGR